MKIICSSGRELHVRRTLAHHSHDGGNYHLMEVALIRRIDGNAYTSSIVVGGRNDARPASQITDDASETVATEQDASEDESSVEAPAPTPLDQVEISIDPKSVKPMSGPHTEKGARFRARVSSEGWNSFLVNDADIAAAVLSSAEDTKTSVKAVCSATCKVKTYKGKDQLTYTVKSLTLKTVPATTPEVVDATPFDEVVDAIDEGADTLAIPIVMAVVDAIVS